MTHKQIIDWLMEGDVSIQYQVWRDLLGAEKSKLQERIAREGWGHQFLSRRKPDGHWGDRFYQPKWISTHYTLLDLRNLCLSPDHREVQESIDQVIRQDKAGDGGIRLGPSTSEHSDICVNGMFLNYASYFKTAEEKLESVVDSILREKMPDGGFNCRTTRSGARHSSMHTTLSLLEGLTEFQKAGHRYRRAEVSKACNSSVEFLLMHELYLSDHTGEVIDPGFLRLSYPGRWRYDILRAMDCFQYAGIPWDDRMHKAVSTLMQKRNKDGSWNLQSAIPGQVHFKMEQAGKPSRWNTLRMMRVIRHYGIEF